MIFGAEPRAEGVEYRAWSPEHDEIAVEIRAGSNGAKPRRLTMNRDAAGYHVGLYRGGKAGDRYRFVLPDGRMVADPGSRHQVESVHGLSVVIDPAAYSWSDAGWQRPRFRDLVIYELHIGTFTQEGTFRAAIEKLPHLRGVHINAIEIMPIGDFPGRWNWGYDGVLIYAPSRAYGTPDDLRALVDAAHQHGIAVILDVVYNHFGPDGNSLPGFSKAFFTEKHHTPWGSAFNFDGEQCEPVRDFFIRNPIYWMEEFHIDGFRLDATHEIADDSRPHLFAEITGAIHAKGGYAIAEDSRNEARIVTDEKAGGYGFDAVWADDFHHVARVGQTNLREGYYADFKGTLDELLETLRHGWLYRGQPMAGAKKRRGTECAHLPPSAFIHCLSNHDQSGNSAFGERPHHLISPEAYRALSMLLCLSPYTPMLFMGQEWGATSPFLYFCDHNKQLAPLITEGRRREFSGFSGFTDHASLKKIPDPQSESTFLQSKLRWAEVREGEHAATLALYTECLRLRRTNAAFRPDTRDSWEVSRLDWGAGAIRYRAEKEEYLLIFDPDGAHQGAIQNDNGKRWACLFDSNEVRFGGDGGALFNEDSQTVVFRKPGTVLLKGCGRPDVKSGIY
jgi:maltooligosyltrehalose trehalohydrolase